MAPPRIYYQPGQPVTVRWVPGYKGVAGGAMLMEVKIENGP